MFSLGRVALHGGHDGDEFVMVGMNSLLHIASISFLSLGASPVWFERPWIDLSYRTHCLMLVCYEY